MSIPTVMRGSPQRSRGARLWGLKNLVYLVVVGLVLLGVSGRPGWPAAWGYLVFLAASITTIGTVLGRLHPDLLAERSGVQEGTEAWDVPLASLSAVWLPLALYVVAALDERFGWPPDPEPSVRVAGAGLLLVGATLATWAMVVNGFFSAVVRLQTERGHTVVTSGPYRFVRHPGYLGSVLLYTGACLVLGSAWALLVVVALAVVLVVRTAREDVFLTARLPGYAEYAARVRRRLVPGVW